MKPEKWRFLIVGTVCFALLFETATVRAADPTALDLSKEGNRYLGEQSRDKVLKVYSDKSIGGVTPNVWYVEYFDPNASSDMVEIKFGAGRQMGIRRPWRPFGGGGAADRVIDQKKLKVDSDRVIKTATTEPLLSKLTVKATQVWLEGAHAPMWKVRIWVAKLTKPDDTISVGDIFISAETGEVVRSELRIDKVDQKN